MFRTTNEAVAYGLEASLEERAWLARLRNKFIVQSMLALSRGQFDLASMFSTQAQFCREAIDAKIVGQQIKEMMQMLEVNDGTQASDMAESEQAGS